MTKADLIQAVYGQTGLSRGEATLVVDAVLEELKTALQGGETVKIGGFGTFRIRQKRERMGRNLRTGEATIITPRTVVMFRPSTMLRQLVSGAEEG